MNREPEAMREIHQIQEKIYEKTKHMSIEEKMQYINKAAEAAEKKYDIHLKKASHVR
ncbi:MAG: hypothetical protein ABH952_00870 [Candidatus Omnitrophota bacterium]